MRKTFVVFSVFLFLLAGSFSELTSTVERVESAGEVTIQLGLCIDGSGSIVPGDFAIIKAGIAAAVRNEAQLPHDGTVELSVVQFSSDPDPARVEVFPTVVTAANFGRIATSIENIAQIGEMTAMADGLYLTWETMKNSPNFAKAKKQVINLATDGDPNVPTGDPRGDVTRVRNTAAAQGLDELDAEGIGSSVDIEWMRTGLVYPQPGNIAPGSYTPGWVEKVADANAFANAVGEKLRRLLKSPIAIFEFKQEDRKEDRIVKFDASRSYDPDGEIGEKLTYEWDFGGPGVGPNTGENPTYVYTHSGKYTVTLKVTDDDDLVGTTTRTVVVGNFIALNVEAVQVLPADGRLTKLLLDKPTTFYIKIYSTFTPPIEVAVRIDLKDFSRGAPLFFKRTLDKKGENAFYAHDKDNNYYPYPLPTDQILPKTKPEVSYKLTVDPNNWEEESFEYDNTDPPGDIFYNHNTVDTKGIKILFVPVHHAEEPTSKRISKVDMLRYMYESMLFLGSTYPLAGGSCSSIGSHSYTFGPEVCCELSPKPLMVEKGKDWWWTLEKLEERIPRITSWESPWEYTIYQMYDRVVGVVSDWNGWNNPKYDQFRSKATDPLCCGFTTDECLSVMVMTMFEGTVAHEIGHTYGLCDDYHGGQACGNTEIGRLIDGYWVVKSKRIESRPAFMDEGQPDVWISDTDYKYLLGNFTTGDPEVLLLSGLIFKNNTAMFVGPQYHVSEGVESISEGGVGNYYIVLLDEVDTVLSRIGFNADFFVLREPPTETDECYFSFSIGWIDGTKKIQLEDASGNVLDARIVSRNPPSVKVTSPNGGEVYNPGTNYTITWSAQDADGDSLVYSIYISGDGGLTWVPVETGLEQTSFTYDFTNLPGGNQYLLSVMANDGVNLAEDNSDGFFSVSSFTVDVSTPPQIITPSHRINYTVNVTSHGLFSDLVSLNASSSDTDKLIFRWINGTLTPPPDGSVTATLEIEATAEIEEGNHTIMVSGISGGSEQLALTYVYVYKPPPTAKMICLESVQQDSSTSNLGKIIFDGVEYQLPTTLFMPAGTYSASYNASTSAYMLDRWETSGGISVADSCSMTTLVTVSGDGTLRAVYSIAPPPIAKKRLTTHSSTQDLPSLLAVDTKVFRGYFLAYQSWETGTANKGDIFIEKYDRSWNLVKRVQATNLPSYQDSPSLTLISSGSNYYLDMAYVSNETGSWDIFVQGFDLDLNFGVKKQITSSLYPQDFPSVVFDSSQSIFIAYQSWETGTSYQGDIFLEKLNLNLGSISRVRVTTETSYQDSPSLFYNHETGVLYVAYVSEEKGNYDIFLKQYDANLNYLGLKFQLTTHSTTQNRPSLVPIFASIYPYVRGFQLAYHSLETGTSNQYDIFIEEFDLNCNQLKKTQMTNDRFLSANPSATPSLAIMGSPWCQGYVAYVSNEGGNWDIWLRGRACDLIVPDISWNPASPKEGDTVTFTITIRNDGTDDAHNFNLAYYIDGTKKGESAVPNLPAGQTTTRVFTWIAVGGSHTVKSLVDSNYNVAESDESNNEREESLTVSGKPDLIISNISHSPPNPVEGDTVTFNVIVENQGTASAVSFRVAYYIDGAKKGEWSFSSLSTGKTSTKTFAWAAVEGAHRVKASADSNNNIDEKVEGNNEKEEIFQVGPKPKPDLLVLNINWTPAIAEEGDRVTFNVTAKNEGTASAVSFKIAYYIDGTKLGEWSISGLAVQDTVAKTFAWTAINGTHTVKAFADSGYNVDEWVETNNEREATFQVGNQPPVASFCCHNGYNYLNNSVIFMCKSTCFNATESYDPDGIVAEYTWSFGDGHIATLAEPIAHHNYTDAGIYTVILKVTDNKGLSSSLTANVEATLLGNLNNDREVNIIDIAVAAKAYGTRPQDADWNTIADLNNDKVINIIDISIVAKEFGKKITIRPMSITITERSGNALTDFQILLTIDTASQISVGKMRPDCQNIRFKDSTGLEMPFWIESGRNSQETKIWIKVPYILASGNTTVYMEYGDLNFVNPRNNPDETFLFFDDFEDGSYEDKWNVHSLGISIKESGGIISLIGGEHGGNEAIMLTKASLSARGGIVLENRANATNYNVVLWFGKAVSGSNDGVQYAIQGNDYVIFCHGDNFGYSDQYAGPATNNWMFYQGKLFLNMWSGSHGSTYGAWTRTDQIQLNQDAEPYSYHVILYSAENGELRVDWIRVRKYAPVEPTVHIAAS